MEGIMVPFLPTSLWVFAGALTIMVLLLAFGLYIHFMKKLASVGPSIDSFAALNTRKQILEADIEQLRQWIENQKAELESLSIEREEQNRLRASLAELEQQCAAKDQENQSLRNEVGELENQRYIITQTLDKLEKEIGDLNAKRGEAQAIEERLAEIRTKMKEAKDSIKNIAELEARLAVLTTERFALENKVTDLRSESESARAELEEYKQNINKSRVQSDSAKSELNEIRKEWAQLSVLLERLRDERQNLETDAAQLKKNIHELQESARTSETTLSKHLEAAQQARTDAVEASRELAFVQKERQRLDIEVSELNARRVFLEQENKKLLGNLRNVQGDNGDSLSAYADLFEKEPVCLQKGEYTRKRDKQDELDMLRTLKASLQDEGLIFSSRVIDAFHTSLKCHDINPITVLAGVSGTGKTLLPMRYAKMMGMHRLVMAVQARWDSPQDMFGFYNYLEKKYKATELSRALIRMDPYNYTAQLFPALDSEWAKERMLLVLLDEMNLARTEYYFSDFLSKLEFRREVEKPADAHNRSSAEIEIDAGPGRPNFRLWVPHNVLFVGTMNEDETTQTLSDKVLDRANIIRFGKPDNSTSPNQNDGGINAENALYLSFSQWISWKREVDRGSPWHDQVAKWTHKLNEALNLVGRPFGFRVQLAIERYVANYPAVEDEDRYKIAFGDQVEQKIIPKLRGIDLGNEKANECLGEVESIIGEIGDEEFGNAFDTARTESGNLGMFQWRGVTRKTVYGGV